MESEERNQDAGNTRQRAVALVASCRRRGSTVQGTDKRTKTQSEVRPWRPSTTRSSDAPILGAIAGSIDHRPRRRRAFKIHTTHRVRPLDTPEKEIERDRRPSLYPPHGPRTAQGIPVREERHGHYRRLTLTRLLVGDLVETVLKDLVEMHRLVVAGRHVFARDVKTSGRSVVEASGHGFAVRPRAEPHSSRYDHPHY